MKLSIELLLLTIIMVYLQFVQIRIDSLLVHLVGYITDLTFKRDGFFAENFEQNSSSSNDTISVSSLSI